VPVYSPGTKRRVCGGNGRRFGRLCPFMPDKKKKTGLLYAMDEKPYQFLSLSRNSIPMRPGTPHW
jgi:hypothetical protein